MLKKINFVIFLCLVICFFVTQAKSQDVDNDIAMECNSARAFFSSDIDENSFSDIMMNLVEPCLEKGFSTTMWVTSSGGKLEPALAIYDAVKIFSKDNVQLKTVAAGQIASSAIFIYLAGKERMILPHSTIFIHDISLSLQGSFSSGDLKEKLTSFQVVSEAWLDIIVKETKLTREQASTFLKEGKTLTAQEAIEYGFAHSIIGSE